MIRNAAFALCLTALTACMSTELPLRPIPQEAQRLAAINGKPLQLAVDCADDADLGHQYLFFFIPFGSVSLAEPSSAVLRELYTQLSLAGYTPLPEARGAPRLAVSCTLLQVSAYDYFFFRSLYTAVELSGRLSDGAGRPRRIATGSSRESEPRRFAFAPQFERAFDRGLAAAVTALLSDLGIQPR